MALNWVIKLMKSIIVKVEEQGDIIRVHNEILANPDVAIDVAKKELDTLKEENEKLKSEIDETRQRGMKGNIIVTCPARDGVTKAVHNEITVNGMKRLENDTEMIIRLINEKSGVRIPISDVAACHPIGKEEKHTFVIKVTNRNPGSAWEGLVAAMMKASNMERTVPVYLNFQLTERRADLAKSVRKAKSERRVAGYSVDQNGKIKIKKNGGARYVPVRSVEQLSDMINS